MTALTFDTHEIVKELTKAGFTEAQAEEDAECANVDRGELEVRAHPGCEELLRLTVTILVRDGFNTTGLYGEHALAVFAFAKLQIRIAH